MEIFCSHQYESGDGTIRCNDVPRSLVEGKGEQQEYFACFDHQNTTGFKDGNEIKKATLY
jgi:hypothetical protein